MIERLKKWFAGEDAWGVIDVLVVLFVALLICMMPVIDAEAGVTDNYHFKQVSTKGATRFVDTGIKIGADTWGAAAVPQTETTILTEWKTDPFYWVREQQGSKLVSRATELLVKFIVFPQTPEERLCKIQEALVFDPAFRGFKLQTNPTATSTGNCTYLKFERKDNGQDVWGLYNADKIGADGKPYCPNP